MRTSTRLLGSVVGLALAALAACTGATEPHRELEVLLSVSSAVVRLGQPVEITVTAVNRGTRPVTINANPCPAFAVMTRQGEAVGPQDRFCTTVATFRELSPGEEFEFHATWNGDSRRGQIEGPPVFLPPGEYQLRGQIIAPPARRLSEAASIRVATP